MGCPILSAGLSRQRESPGAPSSARLYRDRVGYSRPREPPSADLTYLSNPATKGNLVGEGGEDGLAGVILTRRGEQHAVGFKAAHLAGCEVGDDRDAEADELFGGVPLGDAGEDLAARWSEVEAEIDFEAEEFVRLGDALGNDNLRDTEIDFDEVVDGDEGRVVSGQW